MAAALWLADRRVPGAEPVSDHRFVLALNEGKPLSVTEAVPLILPYDFGDCDLLATVEVPAGGELDVVFRRVEPVGAHGRFGVLRLASGSDGPPFRTREEALFDDAMVGGVRLSPGLPASIHLELRGRVATAVVAGRRFPSFVADDDHGSVAFVVRGGEAVVRYLTVDPRAPSPGLGLGRWIVLLGAGVVVGLAFARARAPVWPRVGGLSLVLVGAWALRAWLGAALVVGVSPDPDSVLLLASAALPLCLALGFAGGPWRTAARCGVALMLGLLALEALCRIESGRLRVLEDPRLELYFGPESRQAPFGALARQLHGKNEVHSPRRPTEREEARIAFLGGEPLFEANLDRTHHLAVQATSQAAQRVGRPLRAAVVPTTFPNTLQQILLYERFYAAVYRPVAVVLGVDRWDELGERPWSARHLRAAGPTSRPRSLLLAVALPAPPSVPLASPAELEATLTEFALACRQRGTPLLLATHARIGAAHLQVVERVAAAQSVPLVRSVMNLADEADADALAAALVRLLP